MAQISIKKINSNHTHTYFLHAKIISYLGVLYIIKEPSCTPVDTTGSTILVRAEASATTLTILHIRNIYDIGVSTSYSTTYIHSSPTKPVKC